MKRAYIICGGPGAGKSVYAKRLAEQTGAALLDIDVSTERLVQLALELAGHDRTDRDSKFFKDHFRDPIYEQLFDIARNNLCHASVIIVGPFTRELKDPAWNDKLSKSLGAPVEIHFVSCPPELRWERLVKRGNPRDKAKLENWDEYIRYYDEATPRCPHILIDGNDFGILIRPENKPPLTVRPNNSSDYAIGIDLGGSKIEALLLAPSGEVLFRQRVSTPREEGYEGILSSVAGLAGLAAEQVPPGADYTVGIGIPGSLDPTTGLVRNANSTCLIGHPLQLDLASLLKRPVAVRNDADCFTLAECLAGAGQGYGLVFGVIMGTGCGGGICIDGNVREGTHRIAGEWGHFVADPSGLECYCGNRGCIETLLSGSGMEERFARKHGIRLSMEEIVQRSRRGEDRCRQAFEQFLDDFGRCLGGVISILDPDAVVLGGGLSNIDELYTVGYERVRRYAFHDNISTPILRNRLGDSAGVFGAAWIGGTIHQTT